jgi:hypothetical protein
LRAQTAPFGAFDCKDPEGFAMKQLEARSPPASRAADLTAARRALGLLADLRAKLGRGEPLEPPYQLAGRYTATALTTKDKQTAELFRRVAIDQFTRLHISAVARRTSWATALSDGALAFASAMAMANLCGVDEDNTRWLRTEVHRTGWFKASVYGDMAEGAAWLMVQHADRDPEFQREILALLEPLLATHDTAPQEYALLFDRVAVKAGRPQRYGTQGKCTGTATWQESPVENEADLDKRRAEMSLPPMVEYRAGFVDLCP